MADSIIYHIDVNSAFLSWESAHRLAMNPEAEDLRLIPSAIGGSEESRHGIVLAKSTPAKKYHIVTGEPLVNARRKCPELVIVPPNFSIYVENSNKLMEYLRSFSPVVEQYSIDEAFCDMTGTRKLYGDPIEYAYKVKDEIRERFGFTVNVGISSNHLLAKMASDFEKPDKVHTLFPEEVPTKMWPLAVEDLFFVGRQTSKRLHELGIHTIGDLAKSDYNVIKSHFKKHGEVIWNYANGNDLEMDTDHKNSAAKGYSNETTIPFDITDTDTAKSILLSLSETVGARIRADGAHVKVIQVMMTDSNFQKQSHQTTLISSTNVTEVIYETACRLLDECWDHRPLRLLGVGTSRASEEEYEQLDLFATERNEKLSKLNSAIDNIRSKYGEDSIMRARFINSEQQHMTGGLSKEKRKKQGQLARYPYF